MTQQNFFRSMTLPVALWFRVSVEKLFFWDWPSASKPIKRTMGGMHKQLVHIISQYSKLEKSVVEGLRF